MAVAVVDINSCSCYPIRPDPTTPIYLSVKGAIDTDECVDVILERSLDDVLEKYLPTPETLRLVRKKVAMSQQLLENRIDSLSMENRFLQQVVVIVTYCSSLVMAVFFTPLRLFFLPQNSARLQWSCTSANQISTDRRR